MGFTPAGMVMPEDPQVPEASLTYCLTRQACPILKTSYAVAQQTHLKVNTFDYDAFSEQPWCKADKL